MMKMLSLAATVAMAAAMHEPGCVETPVPTVETRPFSPQ